MSSTVSFIYGLAGALALAAAYVLGGMLRVERLRHRRRWISFGAGASLAYVFVDLLPELSERQAALLEAIGESGLPFPEFRVYTAALIGFLFFYTMDHATTGVSESGNRLGERAPVMLYPLHIGGFAAYSILLGYLVAHRLDTGLLSLALYCIAIAFHFLVVDHSLRKEYGARYDASGRWTLAAAVLAGWAVGAFYGLSEPVLATLWGLVGGGVVLNSVKDELPGQGDARYGAFIIGAIVYTLLILLAQ